MFDKASSPWSDLASRRKYFDEIARDFHLETQEDLYNLTWDDLKESKYAGFIFHQLGGNIFMNLQKAYPDFQWYPWKMYKTVMGYWESVPNLRAFCDWFADENGIHTHEEWY